MAVYSLSCVYCASLLTNLEMAAGEISRYFESIDDTLLSPPIFGKLDATLMDPVYLREQLGVVSFPSILFITGHEDEALVAEWFGSIETFTDIYHTVLDYWYRWNYPKQQDSVILLDRTDEMNSFVATHGAGAIRHAPPALNPNLSTEEQAHMEWLLTNEDGKADPFVLFVKCGNQVNPEYQKLSMIMAANRNVLFFQSRYCTELLSNAKDGSIAAMFLSTPSDWTKWRDFLVKTTYLQKDEDLEQFVVKKSTPSVMWYERISVAPIAFPTYRKIHAVLFVDVDEYSQSQNAIQAFRQICQWSKLNQDEDFVCLIVPQTERRILITFGVDLWTPLDIQATQGGPIQPVLPTLLITDQRFGGTRRYNLDATEILTSPSAMRDFVDKFWKDELTPALQSSDQAPRTNDSGVHVLTGASFREVLDQKEKHTLLFLFAPTCGHCKRFSILWNELARVFAHLGWDSLIDVAKIDVTANEIISNEFVLDVDAVPDVYYFPRDDKTNPIRYDVVDEFGDGAGRLSDPLDIVEWLLDVANEDDLNEEELLSLLLEEKDKNETEATVSKQEQKETDL